MVVNARDNSVSDATVRAFDHADKQLLGDTTTDGNGEYTFGWSAVRRSLSTDAHSYLYVVAMFTAFQM